MHINQKLKNRIVAMLMCILLLSNFGLNVTLATTEAGTPNTGYVEFYTNGTPNSEVKLQENQMIASYTNVSGISIVPKETAVYTITLENAGENVKYVVRNENDEYAALATTYYTQESPLTTNTNPKSTTIDVILKAGQKYYIEVKDSSTAVTMTVVKRNIMELAMMATNIPSNIASAKDEYDASTMKIESFEDTDIKTVQYGEEEIKKYALVGEEGDNKVAKGGWLEGLLVDLVMLVLSTFIWIVEWAIGTEDGLTIDNIIFNRFEQTVIDLTPLGGIQLSSVTTGKGFFYDTKIISVVKVLFNGLKVLAVAIYIVMLLYIGVKILLSIGTKDQKKYFKYIEYWLTGIIFLVIIPYFLPLIPTITNSLVALMEEQARSLNGNYSVSEVLEALGKDTTYLGEDAEIVTLHALINEEIERLIGLQSGATSLSKEEAKAKAESEIEDLLERVNFMTAGDLKVAIKKVIEFIDKNYDVEWTEEINAEYDVLVKAVNDTLYNNSTEMNGILGKAVIPNSIKMTKAWNENVIDLYEFIRVNAYGWDKDDDDEFEEKYRIITQKVVAEKGMSLSFGLTRDIETAKANLIVARKELSNSVNNLTSGLEEIFTNYRDAVVQEKIDKLEDMKLNISQDIMTTLKTTAQEENRFVYAVAWAVLVFQMLAILFMYYKRIFAILLLVILFPIVMAIYIVDKINDGKAQSLDIWFKEFLANMLVQVLHAGVYIILINIGIEACNTDPKKYWFFLILTVCFLFPAERMLRGIISLNEATTLGELRNRGASALAVGTVIAARKGYRGVKDFKNNGGIKGATERIKNEFNKKKEQIKKEIDEPEKKKEEKRMKKQKLQERKNDSRNYRRQLKEDEAAKKEGREPRKIQDTSKNKKPNNNTAQPSKFRKVAKATSKYGKFALKKGAKLAAKTAGLTMTAVESMESFGEEGFVSGAITAKSLAQGQYSVFKKKKADKPQPYVNKERQERNTAQAKFGTVYQGGEMVRNSQGQKVKKDKESANSTANGRPIEYYSSRSFGDAIRTKLNINKKTNENSIDTKKS